MELLFYLLSFIAVLSTCCVILCSYPVYTLLFLIISFLSISCIFFVLGANFAGALEVIIYAGAIMVLFSFVVMLLNIDSFSIRNEDLVVQYSMKKLLLLFMFLVIFLHIILGEKYDYYFNNNSICREIITLKSIGLKLFGPYILIVEMASMLLLAALIISLRIGRVGSYNNMKKFKDNTL